MDEFIFAPEDDEESPQQSSRSTWKVAIIDDEESIHQVTKFALSDFTFEGRELEYLECYSAKEAIELFKKEDDIAVALLDVVMETDHAGLEVARYVREELGNEHTRIVLRTGQPGQAPVRDVICGYDINDYKEKTELTSNKLHILIYSCLRSYRDIRAYERCRKGIQEVFTAIAAGEFKGSFAHGVQQQTSALLRADGGVCLGEWAPSTNQFRVVSSSDDVKSHVDSIETLVKSKCNSLNNLTSKSGVQVKYDNHQIFAFQYVKDDLIRVCYIDGVKDKRGDPEHAVTTFTLIFRVFSRLFPV